MPDIVAIQTQPAPLEQLDALPDALDGSWGSNRQTQDLCQFEAFNDLEAIQVWLGEFADSPQTYRNYRKEAERLLLWAVTQRQKPLSGLMREDFQAYQAFLADPQPEAYWCGPRAPRYTEQWRPFQGPLSASSQRQALIVVNALLSYLVDGGYLKANPLSLVRRRNRTLRPEVAESFSQERYLDQTTWGHLKDYIANLPQDTPREIQRFERTRFLFHFLYLLAPRVSEVASHPMNSIRESRGRWWWFALGKGSKLAKVPVSDEMLDALMRYRAFLGLTGLPDPDDRSPMLRSLKGTSGISANMVYRIVKETVTAAADTIEQKAPVSAAKLRKASTHWFRHTAVTHADDAGVNLKYLQASARHEKVETTAIYQHAEDYRWHEAWKKLNYD